MRAREKFAKMDEELGDVIPADPQGSVARFRPMRALVDHEDVTDQSGSRRSPEHKGSTAVNHGDETAKIDRLETGHTSS